VREQCISIHSVVSGSTECSSALLGFHAPGPHLVSSDSPDVRRCNATHRRRAHHARWSSVSTGVQSRHLLHASRITRYIPGVSCAIGLDRSRPRRYGWSWSCMCLPRLQEDLRQEGVVASFSASATPDMDWLRAQHDAAACKCQHTQPHMPTRRLSTPSLLSTAWYQ
jgi:hypothetical protein